MRKNMLIIVITSLVVVVGLLTGMHFIRQSKTEIVSDSKVTVQTKSKRANKSLIIYFSLSGTTKQAAEQIKSQTGGDLIRIQPEKAYPKDYDDYVKVAQRQLTNGIHPVIKTKLPNLDQYDTILVGFPTWWHQPPMIIHSLFDQFDFAGKTVIPFTTSMSDPISRSMPTMRRLAKADHAKIVDGFRYDDNNQALAKFLRHNHL